MRLCKTAASLAKLLNFPHSLGLCLFPAASPLGDHSQKLAGEHGHKKGGAQDYHDRHQGLFNELRQLLQMNVVELVTAT